MPDGVIDTIETATYVRCSPAALRAWRKSGSGPVFYKAGRLVRYRVEDVDEWIRENSHCKAPVSPANKEPSLEIADDITFVTGEGRKRSAAAAQPFRKLKPHGTSRGYNRVTELAETELGQRCVSERK